MLHFSRHVRLQHLIPLRWNVDQFDLRFAPRKPDTLEFRSAKDAHCWETGQESAYNILSLLECRSVVWGMLENGGGQMWSERAVLMYWRVSGSIPKGMAPLPKGPRLLGRMMSFQKLERQEKTSLEM